MSGSIDDLDPARQGHGSALPPRVVEALARLCEELAAEEALAAACRACGACCDFTRAEHVLYAERIEVQYAVLKAAGAGGEDIGRGTCPYHRGGRCVNREGRPLGCRVYFCSEQGTFAREALHERYLGRVRRMAVEAGLVVCYRPFLRHLEDLRAGGMPS